MLYLMRIIGISQVIICNFRGSFLVRPLLVRIISQEDALYLVDIAGHAFHFLSSSADLQLLHF